MSLSALYIIIVEPVDLNLKEQIMSLMELAKAWHKLSPTMKELSMDLMSEDDKKLWNILMMDNFKAIKKPSVEERMDDE